MTRSEVSFSVAGCRCAATLYRPDGPREKVPCVVMGHGFSLTRRDGIPDYAERFAAAGIAALAFDYRHWGESEGEPRRFFSLQRRLADWRRAVACARELDGVDRERIAVWGMSIGGAHALTTACDDRRIAAVVALVPLTDGRMLALRPAPPGVVLTMLGRGLRERVTRQVTPVPVAGRPGSLAVLDMSEALPGFTRLAAGNGWQNEVSSSGLLAVAGYRPIRRMARLKCPVLFQAGDDDAITPPGPIVKASMRAPHAELRRYPIGHFGCFWPEQVDEIAADQVAFLRRHLVG